MNGFSLHIEPPSYFSTKTAATLTIILLKETSCNYTLRAQFDGNQFLIIKDWYYWYWKKYIWTLTILYRFRLVPNKVSHVLISQIRERSTKKLIFLVLNQNICCGYSNEPSHWDGSFEHPKHMFKLISKEINASLGAQTILNWTYDWPSKIQCTGLKHIWSLKDPKVLKEYWDFMGSRIPLKPVPRGVWIVAFSISSNEQTLKLSLLLSYKVGFIYFWRNRSFQSI